MNLKLCCEKYGTSSQPKKLRSGVFKEIHECPTCKRKLVIMYEEIAGLGSDNTEYLVLGVDYAN